MKQEDRFKEEIIMMKTEKYTDNKDLMIIPGAVHTDLYDNLDVIPFEKMTAFFHEYLK
jgi:hypothetical protein